jgi:hypothetical protein
MVVGTSADHGFRADPHDGGVVALVRPDRHPEFPREIVKYFIRGDPATRPHGLQNGVFHRHRGCLLATSAFCSPAAAGAVLAGRPLFCLSVVTAFPPNRVRTRSAVSSSLSCSPSLVRSTSSRANRSEILCFSCPISSNVVICSCLFVRPTPVITRRALGRSLFTTRTGAGSASAPCPHSCRWCTRYAKSIASATNPSHRYRPTRIADAGRARPK